MATRSELREKVMTILYQINVYNNNNSGNKAYNQLNSISFILPLPENTYKLPATI